MRCGVCWIAGRDTTVLKLLELERADRRLVSRSRR